MSTKTKTTDPMPTRADLLREELSKHQAEADQRRQELLEIDRKAMVEQIARERAFDEQVVADGPRSAEHDKAIEQARRHLLDVIAADPVTLALAAYLEAQSARREAFDEYVGAASRLGRDMSGARLPAGPDALPVSEYVGQVARNIAHDRLAARQADFHARRTGTETR